MRVLMLLGSGPQGLNASLARAIADALPEPTEVVWYEGLDRLPYYSPALDADGAHPEVDRLRAAIKEADAVVMVTPEYNAMPPAVLKNALDVASRPRGTAALSDKPVAVASASPSTGGGSRAVDALVAGLQAALAAPLERTLTVPRAHEHFVDGRFDDETLAEVADFVQHLSQARFAA